MLHQDVNSGIKWNSCAWATPEQVRLMLLAERLEKIYVYGPREHFVDRSIARRADALHNRTMMKLECSKPIKDGMRLMLEYFKSSMVAGDVICVPQHLYTLAKTTEPHAPGLDIDQSKIVQLFKKKAANVDATGVFLEVIDARPESKTRVKLSTKSASLQEDSFVWTCEIWHANQSLIGVYATTRVSERRAHDQSERASPAGLRWSCSLVSCKLLASIFNALDGFYKFYRSD